MLLKPLAIAAAGLAAATQAFLLPPDLTDADTAAVTNAFPDFIPQTAQSKTIDLNCPGCPLKVKNEHGAYTAEHDGSSHLELTFAIDHRADADYLMVNGFAIYPTSGSLGAALTAPQVPDSDKDAAEEGLHKAHSHPKIAVPQLGFGMRVLPEAKDQDGQMDLLAVDLQITELGTTFIDGIPNVHIKLIRMSDGALMIGSIDTTESLTLTHSEPPMDKQGDCTTFICKWKAIIKEHFAHLTAFKHCHGGKAGHAKGGWLPRPNNHHGGHGHHHGHRHSWARLFKRIASHIVLPILIGIAAGVSVSFVGMLVGTIIVALWRKFVRGGSSHRRRRSTHSHHHKAARQEAGVAEEKSGLMDQQEAPPAYEGGEDRKADA